MACEAQDGTIHPRSRRSPPVCRTRRARPATSASSAASAACGALSSRCAARTQGHGPEVGRVAGPQARGILACQRRSAQDSTPAQAGCSGLDRMRRAGAGHWPRTRPTHSGADVPPGSARAPEGRRHHHSQHNIGLEPSPSRFLHSCTENFRLESMSNMYLFTNECIPLSCTISKSRSLQMSGPGRRGRAEYLTNVRAGSGVPGWSGWRVAGL